MSWKKVWNFIWNDNSIWSWLLNVVIAFVLIKFILYPGLGLILSTSHPLVAVVSSSMEQPQGFDHFWKEQNQTYENLGITLADFDTYPFKHGFNRGDIMVLKGKPIAEIELGETMVFFANIEYPIIHRVVKKTFDNGAYYIQTKGDNNYKSIEAGPSNEMKIPENRIIGVAVAKIPYIGLIKVWSADAFNYLRGKK